MEPWDKAGLQPEGSLTPNRDERLHLERHTTLDECVGSHVSVKKAAGWLSCRRRARS